jgi:hypothetical protein
MRKKIDAIEKKFGVKMKYESDEEMYSELKKDVPSLVLLLKMKMNF